MKKMAERLAISGYAVLVVNPYYRSTKAPILPEGADFADPQTRKTIMSMMATLTPETHTADARAFISFLDGQAAVAKDHKLGTMGYCMGGLFALSHTAANPRAHTLAHARAHARQHNADSSATHLSSFWSAVDVCGRPRSRVRLATAAILWFRRRRGCRAQRYAPGGWRLKRERIRKHAFAAQAQGARAWMPRSRG